MLWFFLAFFMVRATLHAWLLISASRTAFNQVGAAHQVNVDLQRQQFHRLSDNLAQTNGKG